MKKRIISLVLVIALMSAMCLSASAASHTGHTSGGTFEKEATATLNISANAATASTTCEDTFAWFETKLTFVYRNTSNTTVTNTYSGYSSVSISPSDIAVNGAISASSTHKVNTPSNGSWSYGLSVTR